MQPERRLSHRPVQVMFGMQNARREELEMSGVTVSGYGVKVEQAKYDLSMIMLEREEGLIGVMEYSTELFEAVTIRRMLEHYERVLEWVVEAPDARIRELTMMSEAERRQIVEEWNETAREYPAGSSIVDLFEEQAVRNPEATALVFDEQQMSYGVLNRKANKVAHFLMEKGVGPEVAIGLCLDRSIEMVIGMLAIFKAGGAYVPMDGTYPTERLRYIAQDARLGVIVSQGRFKDALEGCAAAVLLIDEQCDEISNRDEQNLEVGAAADNLAYVIYTSGSTGNPKGAMNTHRALANRLLWMQDAYQLSQSDSVLQKTPFTFDVSVWEFFWPLLVGVRLVVARPGRPKTPLI